MTGDRVRVAITDDWPAAYPQETTSIDALQEFLKEDLLDYRRQPEGIVVEIDAAALDELPHWWAVEPVGDDVADRDAAEATDD